MGQERREGGYCFNWGYLLCSHIPPNVNVRWPKLNLSFFLITRGFLLLNSYIQYSKKEIDVYQKTKTNTSVLCWRYKARGYDDFPSPITVFLFFISLAVYADGNSLFLLFFTFTTYFLLTLLNYRGFAFSLFTQLSNPSPLCHLNQIVSSASSIQTLVIFSPLRRR